jgi:hypothetical protein
MIMPKQVTIISAGNIPDDVMDHIKNIAKQQ